MKEKMMAMTPERRVKAKVRKVLDKLGAYYTMPVTGGFGNSGAPDFLACLHGRFLGIECKAGKNTTTPLQEKNLRQITEAGGIALVVNDENVDVFETELSRLITSTGE
jgi:Holliday junction resolvase